MGQWDPRTLHVDSGLAENGEKVTRPPFSGRTPLVGSSRSTRAQTPSLAGREGRHDGGL